MKRLFKELWLLGSAILVLATLTGSGLIGCKSATVAQPPALTIVKDTQTKTLTMADVKALPAISGLTGDITSSGTIEGPFKYKGVALTDILKAVGGITANNAVRISAKDGYSMTMSYKQVTEGSEFPTYDNTTGKEASPAGKITVFIAYEKDGKPIDDTVGPLRLGIMAPSQVTDGHWWIKWAQKIEVISIQQPWALSLQGAITQSIDQSSFEAGTAPGCHGKTWTDAQGHVWLGIPLWYLAGYVDDNTTMGYNDTLADQGYQIHLANSNGDVVMYGSAEVKRNDNIIVAFKLDGQPLPSTQWPLALVGSAVDKQHQISSIIKIRLIFPTSSTTGTTTP